MAPPIAMGSHEFGSVEMPLTLRATQTDGDRLDFTVYEAGKQVGRIYENVGTLEGSWCWSITIDVVAGVDVPTSGQVQTFNEAKERFRDCWHKIVSNVRAMHEGEIDGTRSPLRGELKI